MAILCGLSFITCFLTLKDFFLGRLPLSAADAIIYQEQAIYYAHHLSKGVFPLWNNQWSIGTDNVFFLQRIGAFNPFYGILIIALKFGVEPAASYLIFLTIYHLISLIGFYLITKEIFQNKIFALLGFLFALFSSLTLNLFVTYTHLLFCPTVWFFYFLIRFAKKPSLLNLFGITLCTATLLTTYIPFYFIVTFLLFSFLWVIFYNNHIGKKIKNHLEFIKKYWFAITLCLIILALSLTPGLTLKKEGEGDSFLLASRQETSINNTSKQTLSVKTKDVKQFDTLAEFRLIKQFGNFKNTHVRFNFIPIFLFLILFLCLITPTRRLGLFLLLWGLSLVIVSSPTLSPDFYEKIFNSIPILHYMRMMHFFLFFAIIPILILITLHQLKNFMELTIETKNKKVLFFIYLALMHLIFLGFTIYAKADIMSVFFTIIASLIFFIFYFLKQKKHLVLILALIAVIQPIESFYYIQKSARRFLSAATPLKNNFKSPLLRDKGVSVSEYYTHKRPLMLQKNISTEAFQGYAQYAFIIYDNTKEMPEQNPDWAKVEDSFKNHMNLAYIIPPKNEKDFSIQENHPSIKTKPLYITKNIPEFKIIRWTPTHIVIHTNFDKEKFIVFNDPFHSKWTARINNKPASVILSNMAFKGLWAPQGNNIIEFQFGSPLTHLLWGTGLLRHYALLLGMLFLFIKTKEK